MVKGAVSVPNVACTQSIVRYGTAKGNLNQQATGSATAYTQIYPLVYGERSIRAAGLPVERHPSQQGTGSANPPDLPP